MGGASRLRKLDDLGSDPGEQKKEDLDGSRLAGLGTPVLSMCEPLEGKVREPFTYVEPLCLARSRCCVHGTWLVSPEWIRLKAAFLRVSAFQFF